MQTDQCSNYVLYGDFSCLSRHRFWLVLPINGLKPTRFQLMRLAMRLRTFLCPFHRCKGLRISFTTDSRSLMLSQSPLCDGFVTAGWCFKPVRAERDWGPQHTWHVSTVSTHVTRGFKRVPSLVWFWPGVLTSGGVCWVCLLLRSGFEFWGGVIAENSCMAIFSPRLTWRHELPAASSNKAFMLLSLGVMDS